MDILTIVLLRALNHVNTLWMHNKLKTRDYRRNKNKRKKNEIFEKWKIEENKKIAEYWRKKLLIMMAKIPYDAPSNVKC